MLFLLFLLFMLFMLFNADTVFSIYCAPFAVHHINPLMPTSIYLIGSADLKKHMHSKAFCSSCCIGLLLSEFCGELHLHTLSLLFLLSLLLLLLFLLLSFFVLFLLPSLFVLFLLRRYHCTVTRVHLFNSNSECVNLFARNTYHCAPHQPQTPLWGFGVSKRHFHMIKA